MNGFTLPDYDVVMPTEVLTRVGVSSADP